MKTSDAIWKIVKDAGVETVFLLPGGGAMHLVDSLGKSGLNYVAMLHEQGAGYAAVGYAATHGLGVCLTTSGPGATNAITPCAAAWVDSYPVIFISGQADSNTLVGDTGLRTRGQQEITIIPMVEKITKAAMTATCGMAAVNLLKRYLDLSRTGRKGPCWLDIPVNVQAEEIDV